MSHDRIWAPWRLSYVAGDAEKNREVPAEKLLAGADENCFLCRAVADDHDRQNLLVDRGEHTLTVLNRYPYSNGHLLVCPRRHVGQLDELTDAEHLECMQKVTFWTGLLKEAVKAEGFNVGLNLGRVAGAGLPGHLHWHIVPRWSGDNNFMPVLENIRVIPQSLEAVWELLQQPSIRHGGE